MYFSRKAAVRGGRRRGYGKKRAARGIGIRGSGGRARSKAGRSGKREREKERASRWREGAAREWKKRESGGTEVRKSDEDGGGGSDDDDYATTTTTTTTARLNANSFIDWNSKSPSFDSCTSSYSHVHPFPLFPRLEAAQFAFPSARRVSIPFHPSPPLARLRPFSSPVRSVSLPLLPPVPLCLPASLARSFY